ncbi:MAG: LysR family transcriptional regulator [Hyphomonadaceae bacterium]
MSTAHIHVHARVMSEDVRALGPGKADLLERIDEAGSISGGARAMGMSYRRAWLLVEEMNAAFVTPLVEATTGGSGGGGATLTPLGRDMLARFRKLQAGLSAEAARHLAGFRKHLKD